MMGAFPKGHAVVIGIANYGNISVLPDAVLSDARDVAGVLKSGAYCGYDPRNVHLLLDGDATLEKIRNALASVAEIGGEDDTVVIFFSGHGARLGGSGGGESALLPVECDVRTLATTSLSETEFSLALTRFRARRLLVLLDACHSGGAGSLKGHWEGETPAFGYSEKSLARLAQGKGRVLIASCRTNEESIVFPDWRNSVFTFHLLGALRGQACTGGDGVVRVFDVFNHVAEMVKRVVPGRQHPILKATEVEDNFPVALNRGGQKAEAPPLVSGAGHQVWQRLGEVMPNLYPAGPMDQEVWARAGGDPSRLHWNATGRVAWLKALGMLRQGGGGVEIDRERLIGVALEDYPYHAVLTALL